MPVAVRTSSCLLPSKYCIDASAELWMFSARGYTPWIMLRYEDALALFERRRHAWLSGDLEVYVALWAVNRRRILTSDRRSNRDPTARGEPLLLMPG